MNNQKDYSKIWLMFVDIEPCSGYKFEELVDIDFAAEVPYVGAWTNVLLKANSINDALDIAPMGFKELNFDIKHIDKIENIASLVEHNEIKTEIINEADWLIDSQFVFKISDKLFPYSEIQ